MEGRQLGRVPAYRRQPACVGACRRRSAPPTSCHPDGAPRSRVGRPETNALARDRVGERNGGDVDGETGELEEDEGARRKRVERLRWRRFLRQDPKAVPRPEW